MVNWDLVTVLLFLTSMFFFFLGYIGDVMFGFMSLGAIVLRLFGKIQSWWS